MIDHTDYSKVRAVGTVEAHGLMFKIVKARKKHQRGALIFVFNGRSVAICYPRDDIPVSVELARAYFQEKVAESFKTEKELQERLSWLHARGGADIN